MASLLYRLGAFSAKRHWLVIVTWIFLFVGITAWSTSVGKHYSSAFQVPNTESQIALNMLTERFPASTGSTVHVIYSTKDDDISSAADTFAKAAAEFAQLKGVTAVSNPLTQKSAPYQVAADGSGAYLTIKLDENTPTSTRGGEQTKTSKEIIKIGDSYATDSLTVAYTGIPDGQTAQVNTDLIGIGVALIVLVLTFGSLLAAGMPIITAAIGVSISGSLLAIASHFAELSATTPLLGSMLGLAVGIDYALFIVSRHRSNLAQGMQPAQSVAVSIATAGTAVLSAGLTVIIALLGLFVVGIPFLGMMGMGAAIAVALAITAALTLIPALLAAFGRFLIPKPGSKAHRREQADAPATLGSRWAKIATAKPLITIILVLVGLLTLALPASQLRLTIPGLGYDPVGSVSRDGYDAMAEDFGAGVNGPLVIVADISQTDVTQIETVLNALHDEFVNVKGVQAVTIAIPNPALDTAVLEIVPTTGPTSEKTVELVERLRAQAPAFEKANGFTYGVTGSTAVAIDISALLANAIVPFAIVVVGLSLLLLMIAFRSIAVPLSATLGFLLSVGATLGVTTAIFVMGWGADVLGVTKTGPVVAFMPILVMAVLFGLAMDYQVFLVSRMRERFIATRDAKASVISGFSASARVVTAAAIIMMSVFFSFVPGSSALLQPVAFALAVGVALDAFVVRMTLIPAVMALLGKWAWALPRALENRLPDMDIEGEKVHGRLATLRWQRELNPNTAIEAKDLRVTDTHFAPLTFRVETGGVLELVTDSEDGSLILGAIAGRTDARGLLISCGRPLPFDGVHVRRDAVVVLGSPQPGDGTIEQFLHDGLRLNGLPHDDSAIDAVVQRAAELAEATSMRFESTRLSRPARNASTQELWLLELAIAEQQTVALVGCDLRNAPLIEQRTLLGMLASKLPSTTTVAALLSPLPDHAAAETATTSGGRAVTRVSPAVEVQPSSAGSVA